MGGGIRVSKSTNTVVISDLHRNSLYTNKWVGDTLYYVGSGQQGDQTLTRVNKSLYEAKQDGRTIHIFESPEPNEYIYYGTAKVDGYPETIRQLDVNENMRDVLVFKLKLVDINKPVVIEEETYDKITKQREKNASKIDVSKLKQLAENAGKEKSSRTVETQVYDRDPIVNEYVKQRANGICDLCDEPAPFETKDGKPFLECHHVKYLSKGGTDTIDNAVALCPNCHRKIHSLELNTDKNILLNKLKKYSKIKSEF